MSILFCNIGWMEQYRGLRGGDKIVGGGSYVKEHERGGEIDNFNPYKKRVYGYVQAPGGLLDLKRIGAKSHTSKLDGVTVVWTATRPTGGTAVVGWYENATVFRTLQKLGGTGRDYWVEADEGDATLLSVDDRTCQIPRQKKGGMGQANVWYADDPLSTPIVTQVKRLIGGKGPVPPSTKKKSKVDPDRKVQIEKAAIELVVRHFREKGYEVVSVEKDNVGWDLEAWSGKSKLMIEVKGLSGLSANAQLTSNEYVAFKARAAGYRLAIVTDALGTPGLRIARYSSELNAWLIDDHSKAVSIKEQISAVITFG